MLHRSEVIGVRKHKGLTILVGALAGGAFWAAVRPAGYGSGPSLGLIWGFYWLILVYYLYPRSKFPTSNIYMMLAMVVGFSLGGMQGYGQFNQWMRGSFYLDSTDLKNLRIEPISPVYGFYHLLICGLSWGGIPALLLSWILTCKNSTKEWIIRLILAVAGNVGMRLLVVIIPELFLPLYSEGYYFDLVTNPDCQRTIDSALGTYGHLGSFIVLATYTLIKNKRAGKVILPIATGLALSFGVGGLLHLFYFIPSLWGINWWKLWEFSCGFGGGISLFSTFWYLEREGIIETSLKEHENARPRAYLWGFWIPMYVAAAELGRDKINALGKHLFDVSGGAINLKDEFSYGGIAFIAFIILIFLWHLNRGVKEKTGKECKLLYIKRPEITFFTILAGFSIIGISTWIDSNLLDFLGNIFQWTSIISMIIGMLLFLFIQKKAKSIK
ncbi:MAG: hypothetical protein ACFFCS_20745 [Candidatus Hodarchaeota archaeon]